MDVGKKLPCGVRPWGKKFKSSVGVNRRQIYLGFFETVELAVDAQNKFRKENGIPEPVLGRPRKKY